MCLITLVTLALPATAQAKLSLQFDRMSARPGESVYLTFGEYFTTTQNVVHVYLVHAPVLGDVLRTRGGGPRFGPAPRRSGVYKVGRTLSQRPGFTFRVPKVRPARYAAVIWCSTCQYTCLLANFQGGIPDEAYIRPTRALLRVLR